MRRVHDAGIDVAARCLGGKTLGNRIERRQALEYATMAMRGQQLVLAREHELLTSHGHGRVFEGLPTLDTIAERLSAEAASGHIDARIVDAAHLLADKTYGDEVDPSELTPRERRRLERAKLAVREYRRRMLELYAREEAEDDDGK